MSSLKFLLGILIITFNSNYILHSQNVVINEVMSSNITTIIDEFGNFSDWIELYNTSSSTIDLTGYFLSDDPDELDKWTFQDIYIEAYQFLLVYASGWDTTGTLNLHANFKIDADGEAVYLSNNEATLIDEMEVIELENDISFGRNTDGGVELESFYVSSPGSSNNQNSILNELSISHDPGFYSSQIQFSINSANENDIIHYTLDGETPNLDSPVYNSSILFSSRENEDYTISGIPTTPLSGAWQLHEFIWEKPVQSINLINVIRFRSFNGNLPSSDVYSGTYLIDENQLIDKSFPIISIITQKENLFDYDTGIYIPGKRHDLLGWNWHPDGNYMNNGMPWERTGHIEFFEPNGSLEFSQDCGLKIHGGWSAKMPQKSLRVVARDMYGENRFKHKIFPQLHADRYKDFVLRNSGNDFTHSHIRDAFMQELLSDLDMELQAFRPAVTFINGEYWGFHGIRERYDENYFKRHFDIEEEELIIVDVVGNPVYGDNSSYVSMMDFIRSNNPSIEHNYDSIQKMIDISNLIDYYIAQIYYANFDWPYNNVKMWKTTEPSSKWRFLTYDLDGGYGFTNHYDYIMLQQVVDTSISIYQPYSTELFRKLLEYKSFKEQFINRFVFHLKTTFHKDTVIEVLDRYQNLLQSEMENHINRWSYPISLTQWKTEIQLMRDYAIYRPCFCKNHLMEVFDLNELDFDCGVSNLPPKDPELQIAIYPNPTKDYLYVTNEKFDQENITIKLYNEIGQKVYNQSTWSGRYKTTKIKVDQLNAGLYILSVTNDYKTINKKIIIE